MEKNEALTPGSSLRQAIWAGDTGHLERLLVADPELISAREDGERTCLHVATDWPGHFPNVRATIVALATHGADINAQFRGRHTETPLHWAASSDDVDAIDALLDHGANIEAPGAVIGGGTPLADAVAFGQWRAAQRLIERGASATIWQAAALGLMDRLERHLAGDPAPTPDALKNAFWCACHGGQLGAAKRLLSAGADLNWVGYDGLTPLDAAVRNGNADLVEWLGVQGARSAGSLHE